MAKKRKAQAKRDRALLELGEDLLTAVHLHEAIQENEVRAAVGTAHPGLVQASGDLVARFADRFLGEAGVNADDRVPHVRVTGPDPGRAADELEVQASVETAQAH